MKWCVTLIAFLSYLQVPAQHTIGTPDIISYSRKQYNAGTQNWDITQDRNGIMYIANNDGLLTFDGSFWRKYSLPDRTHIRAVKAAAEGKIYIGGQDNIGYFLPDERGRLVYHSLMNLVPVKEKSLGEIWDIALYNDDVFFRSREKICRLHHNQITVFKPGKQWRYMDLANGHLVAQDAEAGLLVFNGNDWQPLQQQTAFPPDLSITSLLQWKKDTTLVTTLKHGFYLLTVNAVRKWNNNSLDALKAYRVFAACPVNEESFLIATRTNGVYIARKTGELIQHFSKADGLQNNDVLCAFPDKDGNLWLGLDNGIDFIAYNNAIQHIHPENQNGAGGYSSILFQNRLFLATSGGLFQSPVSNPADISMSKAAFSEVPNTGGQVWNLSVVNDKLMMGHHEGAFLVNHSGAHSLGATGGGYWTFLPLSPNGTAPAVLGGNYQGITIFNQHLIPDQHFKIESARFIALDTINKNIWIAHPYKGLFKIKFRSNILDTVEKFTAANTLLGVNNNFIFNVKGKILLSTEKGIFQYSSHQNNFVPDTLLNNLFKGSAVSYLREDSSGNIWFVSGVRVGVIDYSYHSPRLVYISELYNQPVSGFEHIYPINTSNIIIGSEKGFLHLNFEAYRKNLDQQIPVHISQVKAFGEKDSMLFGGYAAGYIKDELAYKFNSLRFEFSSASYARQKNIEYSYLLKGFDQRWSGWSPKSEKEYTNLAPGDYTFQVKARLSGGKESVVATYQFYILPPWYRSTFAYIVYLLLLAALVLAIHTYQHNRYIRIQQRKLALQQKQHQEQQQQLQYISEIENRKKENQIIQLTNEKLNAEIGYKNAELASKAMNLVQKSEMLSSIKEELLRLQTSTGAEKESKDVKKLIRTIDKELEIHENWEQFAVHFDTVHTNFLKTIKERFPDLTANELKLCAYLRLSLSTKEIAQLMNISVRGVETSRYRLRKKLDLPNEANLFDFLLTI